MKNENIITIDEPEIILTNITGRLQISKKECNVKLQGKNKITAITAPENATLILDLIANSNNTIEDFWTHQNTSCHIIINSSNQTKLEWNLYIEAKENYNLTLENRITGNNNETKIKVHVVTTNKGICKIKSVGRIEENTVDNVFLEELKGLNLENQNITFFPDLIVNSNSVSANHNATIRCVSEEEKFYLQTKGLDEKTAEECIKDGFLNKKM